MTTSLQDHGNSNVVSLYMALELSGTAWKVGFSSQLGRKARIRDVVPGDFAQLEREISRAKKILGLDEDAPVVSCYEAGRDGFWIHRCLTAMGLENFIVEPASIQVSRKRRRVKTDRVDAEMIVAALIRYHTGDRFACRMIRIPDPEAEDARQLNRELRTIKSECTSHANRIQALLATQGVYECPLDRRFPDWLSQAKTGDGRPVGPELQARLKREFDRLALATEQVRTLQMQQTRLIRQAIREASLPEAERTSSRFAQIAENLIQLSGVGCVTSWTLSTEVFSWRDVKNRRQLGALAGLTPTPHASGGEEHEQGISKTGRGELRILLIELAWGWLRLQPESELSQWYARRFASGTKRDRKRGIVALARKLLVALGKFVLGGEIPAGAKLRKELKPSYRPSLYPQGQAA